MNGTSSRVPLAGAPDPILVEKVASRGGGRRDHRERIHEAPAGGAAPAWLSVARAPASHEEGLRERGPGNGITRAPFPPGADTLFLAPPCFPGFSSGRGSFSLSFSFSFSGR